MGSYRKKPRQHNASGIVPVKLLARLKFEMNQARRDEGMTQSLSFIKSSIRNDCKLQMLAGMAPKYGFPKF